MRSGCADGKFFSYDATTSGPSLPSDMDESRDPPSEDAALDAALRRYARHAESHVPPAGLAAAIMARVATAGSRTLAARLRQLAAANDGELDDEQLDAVAAALGEMTWLRPPPDKP